MKRTYLRSVAVVFILTFAVLSLAPLCLLIECNIQKTVHGQVDLHLSLTVEDGVVTVGEPPSPRLQQALTALLSPPARVVTALWRAETQAAAYLWERLLPL